MYYFFLEIQSRKPKEPWKQVGHRREDKWNPKVHVTLDNSVMMRCELCLNALKNKNWLISRTEILLMMLL